MKIFTSLLSFKPASTQILIISFTIALLLSGCSNNVSHLPSAFELPGAIIGSVVENTSYNFKRRKVESYVSQHYLTLRQDAKKGSGETLEGALNVARITGQKRGQAKNDLASNHALYFDNSTTVADRLINYFAVLYPVKQIDKKMNGFTYTEAKLVISEFANQNFEQLRLAILKNQDATLEQLTSRLNINNEQKRTQFMKQAQSQYKAIYLEPVVVVLMIHSN